MVRKRCRKFRQSHRRMHSQVQTTPVPWSLRSSWMGRITTSGLGRCVMNSRLNTRCVSSTVLWKTPSRWWSRLWKLEAVNSIIIGWIRASIELKVKSTVTFISEDHLLLQTCFSVGNMVRIHQVRAQIAGCRQDGQASSSITDACVSCGKSCRFIDQCPCLVVQPRVVVQQLQRFRRTEKKKNSINLSWARWFKVW